MLFWPTEGQSYLEFRFNFAFLVLLNNYHDKVFFESLGINKLANDILGSLVNVISVAYLEVSARFWGACNSFHDKVFFKVLVLTNLPILIFWNLPYGGWKQQPPSRSRVKSHHLWAQLYFKNHSQIYIRRHESKNINSCLVQ